MKRSKFSPGSLIKYVVVVLVVLIYLCPLVYLLNTSLKSESEYLQSPVTFVSEPRFVNYLEAWEKGNFANYLFNSIFYTSTITILIVLLSMLAAFPISRGYLKRSNAWYIFFILQLFLPGGMVPLFKLAVALNIYDTPQGFILVSLTLGMAFMFFVGSIKSIPKEFDEAAAIDGIGYFRHIFTNIIPLSKPAITSIVILTAISNWNNIVGATIYLSNKKYWPVVLGLFNFRDAYVQNWALLAAAVVIVAMPLLIMYLFLQKYFIAGFMAGGVKG